MVRVITGTLVEVGLGKREPDEMPDLFAARDRSLAGATAPAEGLFLDRVYYPDDLKSAEIPGGARFPRYPVSPDFWPPQEG
jgi:tRNA U38,U39,U40 pseudouridine synthase TruA